MALIAFVVAFLFVVASSDVEKGSNSSTNAATTTERERPPERTTTTEVPPTEATYRVQTGDTLAGIAQKTGVSVEQLQELNPGLDPQALVSGQRIKLRE